MRFAKTVFIGAGVWGIVVLSPLYLLLDISGHRYTLPGAHPQFFYGFVSVAMAWQIAFLVIGSNPVRLRPLMIPAIIEKLGFVATVAVLHGQGRMLPAESLAAVPDTILAGLFIVAFLKTRTSDPRGR
jgi:hypothetical protein